MSDTLKKPQTFDPNAAVEAIRNKIRRAILDVIPQDQWDAMIRAEMHAFMNDTTTRDQWGHTKHTEARIRVIARELLEADARKRVNALLSSPEWSAKWDTTGDTEASDAVKAYLEENAGKILNKWVGTAIQQVVNQIAYVQVPR